MYCLLSLPFLSLDIFLGAGRSWQCFLLINILCEGPFSENFYSWNGYNLEPSSVYHFHHVPLFVFSSLFLNCRQGIYLENLVYNMIWQIKEKEDIVKLACFFKNWTRYELHIISKLLLTTNLVIPEESKGIKQRKESGNLAKEAIIGLNATKH